MPDEVISSSLNKQEGASGRMSLQTRKNVIPITSINDLGTLVGEIQNQLTLLLDKLNNDVSPEFKALMGGYVNKANETEELKVNLEDAKTKYELLKGEILKLRETNRTLINELQNTREILKNLEFQLNNLKDISVKAEEEYKTKIKLLNKQIQDYENKFKLVEEENIKIKQTHEELRQELLDQNFNTKQNAQELLIEKDNLKKQLEEFELILNEQKEQIDFKTKELEYKDALINQLIRQTTEEKLRIEHKGNNIENLGKTKKKRFLFF